MRIVMTRNEKLMLRRTDWRPQDERELGGSDAELSNSRSNAVASRSDAVAEYCKF